MPLLDIRQTRKITIICTLEDSTANQVNQYAAFVNASPDDVVNKALEFTFGKDSEFQKFRATEPKVPAVLRIKKAVVPPAKAPRKTMPAELAAAD